MRVIKVEPEGFASNSYILTADDKTAIVIDPADEGVIESLERENLSCKFVLLTHGHFDHVGMCGEFYKNGVPVCCGELEREFIFSPENRGIFGGVFIPTFEISRTFKDGEKFTLCGIDLIAIHTPGHTAGSLCYIAEDCIFTGDTLFCRSIGRSDLPTGDMRRLSASVKKLFLLEGDYKVYPGHGENSTLEVERRFNPYIR